MSWADSSETEDHPFDYDLAVIGGGSGGLACAQEAAKLGKRVVVFDYVKPSPQGTQWGLGGTCVNVGCIPKKLMHHSAQISESIVDASHFGWDIQGKPKFNWSMMVENVQNHIGSLNWGYRVALRSNAVDYVNGLAVFEDPHTVVATMRNKTTKTITSRRFVIATGGRPHIPSIPGGEHAITSDDIFSLSREPGKTLVVGASYVALECAGFLTAMGYPTTVMVRSILLRGFDEDCATRIGNYMELHGTTFIHGAVPTRIEKLENEKLRVFYNQDGEKQEEYDTVLFAIGRYADTTGLSLEKAGVQAESNGKLRTIDERSNVPHIYAIGDVLYGKPELTPVAIKAGKLLANRLYNNSTELMDYDNIPTTVFTPLEYGLCGLSENAAYERHGKDNVEVYLSHYKPTYWNVAERENNTCYVKLVCLKPTMKVIGWHILGVEAGEITQGVGVAMKAGATKQHFDSTIGIHPTSAEVMTSLDITRASGLEIKEKGC